MKITRRQLRRLIRESTSDTVATGAGLAGTLAMLGPAGSILAIGAAGAGAKAYYDMWKVTNENTQKAVNNAWSRAIYALINDAKKNAAGDDEAVNNLKKIAQKIRAKNTAVLVDQDLQSIANNLTADGVRKAMDELTLQNVTGGSYQATSTGYKQQYGRADSESGDLDLEKLRELLKIANTSLSQAFAQLGHTREISESAMKITRRQLRRLIREACSGGVHEDSCEIHEQGCAEREEGCVKRSDGGDEYGPAGTYYILNNKEGGVWRKGFKTKQSAKDSISAMHARKG